MLQTQQTRKSCSAPKSFEELAWICEQNRQSHAIAAATPSTPAETFYSVQDVLKRAAFARNEWGTLTDYAGKFLQSTMDIRIDGAIYTVYCKKGECGLEWSARCPNRRYDVAPVMIDAVQRYIEAKRAGKAVN